MYETLVCICPSQKFLLGRIPQSRCFLQVVGVPCNAEALLVYDPLSQECVGIPTTYHATGPTKRLGYIDSCY